jgi:hypothetical protein
MMRRLLPVYPSITMIAIAPVRAPPQRIGDYKIKKTPCPPCLGEALKRESFVLSKIFMVWVRTE